MVKKIFTPKDLDANNLYGYGMSQYLPTGNFEWLNKKDIDKLNLDNYSDESDKGLILEIYLEYPEELHDLHSDYPLAPEKICVKKKQRQLSHSKTRRMGFNSHASLNRRNAD